MEDNFWKNSETIAKVLDVINEIKKDQKLGKKLIQGDVRYAVKEVEPYARKLVEKTVDKFKDIKKSILEMNGLKEDEVTFNVTYEEIRVTRQTLEKVTLLMPYSFNYALKCGDG